jgi:hypothetical protein
MELFERYCLPSVQEQSIQSFRWIIYFDPQSPEWLIRRVNQLSRNASFTPIYRAAVSHQELMADLHGVTGAKHRDLITTNLDNDDGLARDFVERLQEAAVGQNRTAIYFVQGLIRSGPKLYLRTDRTNAFCSVQEGWEGARTCWTDWHNLLPRTMDSRELDGGPAWLQLVHDGNVSNRIRGQRVAAGPYLPRFGHLLNGLDQINHIDLLKDLVLDRPARFVRDSGRTLLKRAALTALGKDGLDELRSSWALRSANRR